jgi:hypothetical protein
VGLGREQVDFPGRGNQLPLRQSIDNSRVLMSSKRASFGRSAVAQLHLTNIKTVAKTVVKTPAPMTATRNQKSVPITPTYMGNMVPSTRVGAWLPLFYRSLRGLA